MSEIKKVKSTKRTLENLPEDLIWLILTFIPVRDARKLLFLSLVRTSMVFTRLWERRVGITGENCQICGPSVKEETFEVIISSGCNVDHLKDTVDDYKKCIAKLKTAYKYEHWVGSMRVNACSRCYERCQRCRRLAVDTDYCFVCDNCVCYECSYKCEADGPHAYHRACIVCCKWIDENNPECDGWVCNKCLED